MKTIVLISMLAMLSACASPPQHWNRAHGEEYKFYPSIPGSAITTAEIGRACWLEENRENWDQCS